MDSKYKALLDEQEYIKKRIQQLEEKLKSAPKGYLRADKLNNSYRYFVRLPVKESDAESKNKVLATADDPAGDYKANALSASTDYRDNKNGAKKHRVKYKYRYLSARNIKTAESLAEKTYNIRLLNMYKIRLKAIEHFVKYCPPHDELDIYSKLNPGCRALIRDGLVPMSEAARKWAEESYEKSSEHPETLIQPAPGGLMVRSKSEAMIVSRLRNFALPFRYECAIWINGRKLHPDFMIMDPNTGDIVIWEHFGMMDDPDYLEIWRYKMAQYKQAGYIPGVNMIVTYESKAHPLSQDLVDAAIRAFFRL